MKKFDFKNLFIYDMANNHQGDINHGYKIIDQIGDVTNKVGVRAALKFQFRQLDTFIHPDYQKRDDLKFVQRFNSTRLNIDDFKLMAQRIKDKGMFTMSTPFDEPSVDIIVDMNLDLIKVASASADDKPLLKKIAKANKPVVISTGGLRIDQIDWLVSFFEAEGVDFALMHVVAIYPTPDDKLNLNQIDMFKERYPHIPIGFSTHEIQDNYQPIQIAYSKGAELFERHVGVETDTIKLNDYSSTPDKIEKWLKSFKQAEAMCGPKNRVPSPKEEVDTLTSLKRGVYLKKDVKKGDILSSNDIYFAMPVQEKQMISANWQEGITVTKNYKLNEALNESESNAEVFDKDEIIYQIMLQVKGLLSKSKIHFNEDASIEISHHYGLERFREYGAVIVTCINREYAKKYVIQLPRQKHPYHFHKRKEETFQLLYGDLEIEREGHKIAMKLGDTCLIEQNQWHKFHTLHGAIVEEISTKHYNDDSFYEDPKISKIKREDRKTNVDSWIEYFRKNHAL
ncbi:N-acetylneuraminate synthase family protein [Aliarcobacter butzleri]|uniref:N-acetylneuraminate synthase family protein n=1 Tax=Aliarcobacter butzleri TaxID=28197 RepID=UPI000F483D7D|nr:N-acetylneuraminate synthase family protein [Aliarcobacter butzleri]